MNPDHSCGKLKNMSCFEIMYTVLLICCHCYFRVHTSWPQEVNSKTPQSSSIKFFSVWLSWWSTQSRRSQRLDNFLKSAGNMSLDCRWSRQGRSYLRYADALILQGRQLTQVLGVRWLLLKADLHGTILSHATSLWHAYDTEKVVRPIYTVRFCRTQTPYDTLMTRKKL